MASETDTPVAPSAEQEKPKLSLQLKIDAPSTCKRHVTVTVARADIERYFSEAFDEFSPTAEVPGFRPGKAPRKLVESRFREQMANQVKGSLLMDSVSQASEECDFSAISEPDFDFEAIELPAEGPMTFEFDIEVRPDFEVPEWKGLELERPVHEYTDAEVDEHLQGLLARYGRLVNKSGPVEANDQVELGITFTDGDSVVSKIDNLTVTVRPTLSFPDGNVEGFDKLMVGAQPGETKVGAAKVSEDAESEPIRGKELAAEFHVKSVKRMDIPELTANFLDRIGGFEDEEDLRGAVREELERQLGYHQQKQIRDQIAGQLTETANWELPEDLVRRQARRELERAVLELRASGFGDDVIRAHQNTLRQNSIRSTERALKEHFILEKIAEDREIDAVPEDFEAEIRLIAMQSSESPRRVRARLEKRGQTDAIRNQIIERKVIELITEHAKFDDKPFEPQKQDTEAVEQAISGHEEVDDIPDAKYGGEAEELSGSTDHS
jgi:trigger factor